jgi:N-methylhydantoinase A/oxoprolinase/acetone carboxylase beta subunit
VGIHLADIVQEAQEPTATQLSVDTLPELSARLQALASAATAKLQAQGFDDSHISTEHFLNLRCVADRV